MFGNRNDNQMAESESIEWQIENQYTDWQIKQFQFDQMQEAKRRADQAAYEAEQRMYTDRAKRHEQERLQRAAMVKRNGGKWIELPDGSFITGDGTIAYPSDLC